MVLSEVIGAVKTQPLFYFPLRFEDYKADYLDANEYKTPLAFDDINATNDDIARLFIFGVGKWLGALRSGKVGEYESFIKTNEIINDSSFLESALSIGFSLLDNNGYRKSIINSAEIIDPTLGFIRRYGLNSDDILLLAQNNNNNPSKKSGCNVVKLAGGFQQLAITYARMTALNTDRFTNDSERYARMSVSVLSANIFSRCLFSEKQSSFKTVLVASSLIDIANFQLSQILSDGAYTRKCANPSCVNVIIGGRSDKKTCSDACRKALERYNTKKEGNKNGRE